jgi:alkanesulfonate monooxygenase SsuD/methylene tetrahydromethanopterin reductase-like flavin-dependent oxidoreductase (luciferase family)
MRYGLFFPPFDALADARLVAALAAEAEAAGWDGVFLWDHLVYSEPVERILDPWICLAAAAMTTERVLLGPMVTPLSRRRPAVVARQALSLDHLSRGRLVLGFGLGDDWRTREMSRFGEEADPVARAALLDERLGVLTGLLSGNQVDHAGPHERIDAVTFLPAPYSAGGIPIWMAARWPNRAPVRRAARYDGLFVIQCDEPGRLEQVRSWLGEAGAGEGFDLVANGGPEVDPQPWAQAGATWWLTQLGPYGLELTEVRRIVAAGPRRR